tara:strand:+ start:3046 stop:3747 length:702 start_codon:yes stop_codon:yes gene_type:complete
MKHIKGLNYTLFIVFILALVSCADTLIGDEGQLDEDIYLNYQTITDLELPFEEEWHIEVGGRTHRANFHHFVSRSERYASDIVIEIDGRIRIGDGSNNEDHHCFGKRLNAPGNGKIIELENNVDDNQPGKINRDQPGGNYIIIDHLNGESSIMAHLKKGSIIVSLGDTVMKGQEIGKAGNSGASTAPHLHYELRGTEGALNGVGLPAQFVNYYEDNAFTERGELDNGQKVRKN